jgi:hypothetical protein
VTEWPSPLSPTTHPPISAPTHFHHIVEHWLPLHAARAVVSRSYEEVDTCMSYEEEDTCMSYAVVSCSRLCSTALPK